MYSHSVKFWFEVFQFSLSQTVHRFQLSSLRSFRQINLSENYEEILIKINLEVTKKTTTTTTTTSFTTTSTTTTVLATLPTTTTITTPVTTTSLSTGKLWGPQYGDYNGDGLVHAKMTFIDKKCPKRYLLSFKFRQSEKIWSRLACPSNF